MFKDLKIKTFELEELSDRIVEIKTFKNGHTALVIARDIQTGDFFVLKQINNAIPENLEEMDNNNEQ